MTIWIEVTRNTDQKLFSLRNSMNGRRHRKTPEFSGSQCNFSILGWSQITLLAHRYFRLSPINCLYYEVQGATRDCGSYWCDFAGCWCRFAKYISGSPEIISITYDYRVILGIGLGFNIALLMAIPFS